MRSTLRLWPVVALLVSVGGCESTSSSKTDPANALEIAPAPETVERTAPAETDKGSVSVAPPSPPGGPVPIPYPNGVAVQKSDSPSAARVNGSEVTLKPKSRF